MEIKMEKMTVGEYRDKLELGEIENPIFQSGLRWKPDQIARLGECLVNGRLVPPIIVAVVPADDGDNLVFRVDGNQRTEAILQTEANLNTAIETAKDDEAAQLASDRLDSFLSAPLYVMYCHCDNIVDAATLFRDLNNGTALSGIQKNKAQFPVSVMDTLSKYQRNFERFFGKGAKMGKVNIDTAAAFLLAAQLDPVSASTGAASASKVLANYKGECQEDRTNMARLMEVLTKLGEHDAKITAQRKKIDADIAAAEAEKRSYSAPDIPAYGGAGDDVKMLAYWSSPVRMVPLYLACTSLTDKTPDDIVTACIAFNPASKAKCTVIRTGKGKNPVTKRERTEYNKLWLDTANGKAQTAGRIQSLREWISNYNIGEDCAPTTHKTSTKDDVRAALLGELAG